MSSIPGFYQIGRGSEGVNDVQASNAVEVREAWLGFVQQGSDRNAGILDRVGEVQEKEITIAGGVGEADCSVNANGGEGNFWQDLGGLLAADTLVPWLDRAAFETGANSGVHLA